MSKAFRWAVALTALLATSPATSAASAASKAVPKQKVLKLKMPKKAAYKSEPRDWPPAPIPALLPPSWTGFYAGLSLGGRMADAEWTTTAIAPPAVATLPATVDVYGATLDDMHLRVGGFVGYNWQMGPAWVVGVEGDFGWADKGRSTGGIPGTFVVGAPAALTDGASIDLRWDASARGRLGFLVTPSWMIYGTGGLAWQNFRFGASCAVAGGYCVADRSERTSATRLGWTIGGGVEALLPGNWTARAEYRYADFRAASHTFFAGTGDDVFVDVDVRTHTVLFGVAYKFGGDPVRPITSRY